MHDIVYCTRRSTLFINLVVLRTNETEIDGIRGRKDLELGTWRHSPVLIPQRGKNQNQTKTNWPITQTNKNLHQKNPPHSDGHKLKFDVIFIIPDHEGCNCWHTVDWRWKKKYYSSLSYRLEFQENVSVVQSCSQSATRLELYFNDLSCKVYIILVKNVVTTLQVKTLVWKNTLPSVHLNFCIGLLLLVRANVVVQLVPGQISAAF